jgi:hypothetical protein
MAAATPGGTVERGRSETASVADQVPGSEPLLWYATLGLLGLWEIVEVPVAAAVVVGQLLVRGRRGRPTRDVGTALGR